jgi:F5/8 type C domain
MTQRWFDRCRRHAVASTAVFATIATAVSFISPVAPGASAGTTTTTTAPTTTTTAVPGSNCSATEGGYSLDRQGWTASSNAPASSTYPPANALDGNYSSRFSTSEDQASGLYFEVNLGSVFNFNELEMSTPGSPTDYARGFVVYVSNDGSSWARVAICTGSSTPEVVSFSPQSAKYVRVVLDASANDWWSIDEFHLYNPTTQPTTTTTSTVPPTTTTTVLPAPRCAQSWPRSLVHGSLIATKHGYFIVIHPCNVRRVLAARVRVTYHVERHGHRRTMYRWQNFRLGSAMRGRFVELKVARGDWLRWNGRLHFVRNISLLLS